MNTQQRNSLETFLGNFILRWPPGQRFELYDVLLVQKRVRDDNGLLAATQLNLSRHLNIKAAERHSLQLGKTKSTETTPKRWEQTVSKGFAAGLAAGIEGANACLEGEHNTSNSFHVTLDRQVIKTVDSAAWATIDEIVKDPRHIATMMERCKSIRNGGETWYVAIVTGVHKANISVSGERANDFGAEVRAFFQFGGRLQGQTHSESTQAFQCDGVVGVRLLVYPIREENIRLSSLNWPRVWTDIVRKKHFVIQTRSLIDSSTSARQLRWDRSEKTYIAAVTGDPLASFGWLWAQSAAAIQFVMKLTLILALGGLLVWCVLCIMLRVVRQPPEEQPLWKRSLLYLLRLISLSGEQPEDSLWERMGEAIARGVAYCC